MKKLLKYISNTILCGLIIFLAVFLPKINAVNSTINNEFVYIENSEHINFNELRSQIDKSLPNEIFTKDTEKDRLNPLKSTYVVVFNGYQLGVGLSVVRFAYVQVSRENIFSLDWKVNGLKLGFVYQPTLKECLNSLYNYDFITPGFAQGQVIIMDDPIPTHNIELGQVKPFNEKLVNYRLADRDVLLNYISKSTKVESNSDKFLLFAPYYDDIASQNSKGERKEGFVYYANFAVNMIQNNENSF